MNESVKNIMTKFLKRLGLLLLWAIVFGLDRHYLKGSKWEFTLMGAFVGLLIDLVIRFKEVKDANN